MEAYYTLLKGLPKIDTAIEEKQRIEEKLKQFEQVLKQL
jgi:hypothetical protein